MIRRIILRLPVRPRHLTRAQPTRQFATTPPPHPPTSQTRIERFNRRLPKFLHRYTNALSSAPVSHITSFLILHEITAIVPLFGLAATFHYTHWLPSWFSEGAWALQGVERFGAYFRRKGWIKGGEVEQAGHATKMSMRNRAWTISEGGARLIVELATAYAITKVLLPIRIAASIWATPWFAKKTVIPLLDGFKRTFGGRKAKGSAGVGTGSVEANTPSKSSRKETRW